MGEAIATDVELITDRKETYKQNGVSFYRPWVFLITDGAPTDGGTSDWVDLGSRIRKGEKNKSYSFFSVGVEGADFDFLNSIGARPAMKLKGLAFRELFSWLSASMSSISSSNPGDEVPLADPSGWGSIQT